MGGRRTCEQLQRPGGVAAAGAQAALSARQSVELATHGKTRTTTMIAPPRRAVAAADAQAVRSAHQSVGLVTRGRTRPTTKHASAEELRESREIACLFVCLGLPRQAKWVQGDAGSHGS